MFKLFKRSPTSSPVANPISHIDPDGTLHGIRDRFTLSKLSNEDCLGLMDEISEFEKNGIKINLVKGSGGFRDYNECLSKLNVTFDTTLATHKDIRGQRSSDSKTLTLTGCKAIKKGITGTSDNFKYEIFSPAATTEPPDGGTRQETLVGTFTQLPVSLLLRMARQETPFSFASFYGDPTKTRKSYFSDYLSCLKNVKEKFGSDNDPNGTQLGNFRSVKLSILRQFGKNLQCRIVFLKGNVGEEIQKPENNGACFLLPSQLNGAEYPSPQPVTDVNNYKYDPTGGPLGQLSCHPVVAKFILDHAERTGFTSSPFLVINAVDDVLPKCSRNFNVKLNNGYLEVSEKLKDGKELELNVGEDPSPNATAIFDSFCDNLKVLQTDDVPASGLKPPNEYKEFNWQSTSKVSLIYASAVPLSYVYSISDSSGIPKKMSINPEKSTLQYCVAGFDLVAQYFGAMVSAYNKSINQKQQSQTKVKLFLTPLGGGAFKNPREMIACSALLAYYQAQQLFEDFDDKVEVIFLVYDGSTDECSDFSEFFNSSDVETAEAAEGEGSSFFPPRVPKTSKIASETSREQQESEEAAQLSPAVGADVIQGNDYELPSEEARPATMTGDQLFEKYGFDYTSVYEGNGKKYVIGKLDSINNVFTNNTEKQNEPLVEYVKRVAPLLKSKREDLSKNDYDLTRLFKILKITYHDSDNILNLRKILFLKMVFTYFISKVYLHSDKSEYFTTITQLLTMYESFIKEKINPAASASETSKAAEIASNETGAAAPASVIPGYDDRDDPLDDLSGGSKSRRRHRHKPARKTTRKYKSKSKSKSKPKTHRRRRAHHSRTRKHKKYTSRRR